MSRNLLNLSLIAITCAAIPVSAQEWEEPTEETQKLIASDGDYSDRFGWSVALSSDVAVVGNRGNSLYLFRYNSDDELVEEQIFTALGALGYSVDVSGDIVIAGAPQDDQDGTLSGSAYVFRHDPDEDEWVEEQQLTASDAEAEAIFGRSVAVLGDVAVVGASGDGSAYVFHYDSDEEEWIEDQKLSASDDMEGDNFGIAVAISGDVVVVGACHDDDDGESSGSAYVFRYDSDEDEWVEEQKLTASDGAEGDTFGRSVAISGDSVVVGAAVDDNDNGTDSGSAYVFRYEADDGWVEEQKLTTSDGAEGDYFGWAVDVSDGLIVAGARNDDDHGSRSGSAYVFRYNFDGEWVEEQKLTPSDGAAIDGFGFSARIVEDVAVVGSYQDDVNGLYSGSVYLFRLGDPLSRGDIDGNGVVRAIVDSYRLLCWGFLDCDEPACLDTADVDDDGEVEPILDALYLLDWAFSLGPALPYPGANTCGRDPTADDVGCETVSGECL